MDSDWPQYGLSKQDVIRLTSKTGEGFYESEFNGQNEEERASRRLTFVKRFDPPGWVIGAECNLEVDERELQNSLLNEIGRIRFGDDGYVFAATQDGIMLVNSAQQNLIGQSVLDRIDPNGVNIHQEMLRACQNLEGSFVEYVWLRPSRQIPSQKISFVRGVKDWNWIIGAGVYADSIADVIAKRRTERIQRLQRNVFGKILLLLIAVGAAFCLADFFSRSLRKEFAAFTAFFKMASTSFEPIPRSDLRFQEFKTLADSANRMAADRKRAEEQLKQHAKELARSNQELQQFAYVASHDLQEPLRMVSNYVQLLARRYEGKLDDDADEFIQFAVTGATRMKTLIDDLLEYSHVGTKGKPFKTTDCDRVLTTALTNLSLRLEETGAIVTRDSLPQVLGDDTQLEKLFQNLLSNAIKFHGNDPPRIHISAVKQENEWIFSVADNGIGIKPEFMERIFVIFQRLHNKDANSGTGIGLAICKKIVERHDGRIWVESKKDAGSTFYFTLPVDPAMDLKEGYDVTKTNRYSAGG